jgi:membrane associated rhomboid family serine protease
MIPLRDDQPRYSQPYINYFLIALNSIIFLFEFGLQLQSPRALNGLIFEFGAIPHAVTTALTGPHFDPASAFLPIFTSIFLHGSWLHLIGNMWVLWIFGDNIEDYLGHFQYLVFYLICGLTASFTHILLNLGSRVPSIGASGAIAGVMGAYFVLFPRAKVLTLVPLIIFFTFWWLPAWIVLGYWFVVQFLSGTSTSITTATQSGGVAFWAHVGGFVAGILLIKVFPERAQRRRYVSW